MNDYIARFRVNDFEKQELKEHMLAQKSYILIKKLL